MAEPESNADLTSGHLYLPSDKLTNEQFVEAMQARATRLIERQAKKAASEEQQQP